ncbi:DUF6161 domain-containing protein [Caulobacter sp. Root343]|uniref:DUF6161 domain-containing protein n=1 Tax=Caulobacter sp. Root343 TaxID=1736520 RepID=UPI0006FA821D|nr:DUF6161 domain-containing protein [Caulobacter sp. Root343]KQV66658.1 hypothetical protein ASC70_12555 [Caulobacter sp. Root343]
MSTLLTVGDVSIPFDDHQKLGAWLEAERTQWDWMNGRGLTQSAWNAASQMFHELNNEVLRNAQNGQPLHVITPQVESRFHSGPLVYSGSDEGRRILEIRRSEGDEAAVAAYAYYRQFVSFGEIRGMAALRGIMAFAYPARVPVDQLIKDLSAERTQSRRTMGELTRRFEVTEKALVEHFGKVLNSRKKLANETIRIVISQAKAAIASKEDAWTEMKVRVDEAILRIDTTELAYAEKLGLEAPVTYWKRKSRIHKAKEAQHLRMLRFYFAGAAVAILFVFYQAADKLHELITVPTPVLIVVGAGLTLFAALLLWIARILTRLYLSEHHLRTDADERAVMANAYLALIQKGSLESTDRAIILQALFRPSVDGVVKDDGPPDLNAIVALSKIGMPTPTR